MELVDGSRSCVYSVAWENTENAQEKKRVDEERTEIKGEEPVCRKREGRNVICAEINKQKRWFQEESSEEVLRCSIEDFK